MKNILLFSVLLLLVSCSSRTILDKKFTYDFYESLDYKKLLNFPDISEEDLSLLNYCIIRQRDYFNYAIEGKTYQEILDMAKNYQQKGLPVEITMNDNGLPHKIEQKVSLEGVGFANKSSRSKRILKTLNFSCEFKNPTDKDIVLLNSSFIINGPFGDYITTVNYEINCILKANSYVNIPVIVVGKAIKQNLLFEGHPKIIQMYGIDGILTGLLVEPSGLSFQNSGKYFKECFFDNSRIQPHNIVNFKDHLKDKEWKKLGADGTTYQLNFGDKHIPDLSDEPILMQ